MNIEAVPTTVESLLVQAKALSDRDREELARRLYETLPPLPESPEVWDDEVEAEVEWNEELQRRLDEVSNGTAELVPWKQALEEMREELRRKHGA